MASLLEPDEPAPVTIDNPAGRSPILLICEHAGNRLPRKLGDLGLSDLDRQRHIAWDIGAAGVALDMARRLDATLLSQTYSRLVCDCNRPTTAESFIPRISETTVIPGNAALSAAERRARTDEIYWPLHRAITGLIERRLAAGQPVVVIAMHSFTPVFMGERRPMHAGLLFDRDRRLADLVGSVLRADGRHLVVDNEPYALDDRRDFTIPEHGERRGLPALEFEVRQDLIATPAGQAEWGERLADALAKAVRHLLAEVA